MKKGERDPLGQGRKMIGYLKQRPLSYREMTQLSTSVCVWKRVAEALAPGEVLIKTKTDGRVKWRVKTVRLERT